MIKYFLFVCMCVWYTASGQSTNSERKSINDKLEKPRYFGVPASLENHHCASDAVRDQLRSKYPAMRMAEEAMNSRIKSSGLNGGSREEDLYIPVVVHIMHIDGEENISDTQVLQGIQDLNDAFANAGAYYNPAGMDTHIRFCLAQQDELGLATTGITRTYTTLTDLYVDSYDVALKDLIRWDPLKYLNIWLVKEISSSTLGYGVAGYAYLPYAHGLPMDGIVNEARWFGSTTDFSKVHIHEAGHYLGLYHTFEGACNNNDCTAEGDLVCDTPPDQSTAPVSCSQSTNTCFSDEDDVSTNNPFRPIGLGGLGDQNDMFQNYMDYGDQACQFAFTEGQSVRMNNALQNERQSLLQSNSCLSSCGIAILDVTSEVSTVASGDVFNALQVSLVTVDISYSWIWQGQSISTNDSLSYLFNNTQIGEGYLVLTITNVAEGCFKSDSLWLEVTCNPAASIQMSPEFADLNELISFDGNNSLATSYQWFLDDVLVSTSSLFNYASSISDSHHIYLVTGNGVCTDTSDIMFFTIGECASGQNNRWVIGSAAGLEINFNEGVPNVSTIALDIEEIGIGNDNMIQTIEGIATMSDRNGNLLFYSDGNRIYNRLHQPFYFGHHAGGSSSQGVQIIQDPGNSQQYYVFMVENFGGLHESTFTGFSYLKVDMALNDGLGGVVSSSTSLLPQVNEKQSATRHCNGHDVWVVCHGYNNDLFYSYLITDEGIASPVISNLSSIGEGNGFLGYMKFTPQGNIMAYSGANVGRTLLLKFDNSTGEVSPYTDVFVDNYYYGAYGMEFSPDGSKLYFTTEFDYRIYQMDLSSGVPAVMLNSVTVIGESNRSWTLGALQLAPTGEIYLGRSSDHYLDVIHSPNLAGADCDFETDYLDLPIVTFYGLQNILPSEKFAVQPVIMGPSDVCVSAEALEYTVTCGANTWTYLGNNSIEIISEEKVRIVFSEIGIDTLICTRLTDCLGALADTIIIQVGNLHVDLGPDINVCSTAVTTLSADDSYLYYNWSNGGHTPQIDVTTPGSYWLEVFGLGGCSSRDTIQVFEFVSPFDVPDMEPFIVCPDHPTNANIVAPVGDFNHYWFDLNGTNSAQLQISYDPTYGLFDIPIYYVNDIGCIDIDTVHVVERDPLPPFNLWPDVIDLCPGSVVVLEIDSAYQEYDFTWQNGQIDDQITVYDQGLYSAYATDLVCGGYFQDMVYVNLVHLDYLYLPETALICDSSSIILDAGWYYTDVTWQDGSTNTTLSAEEEGLYWVTAHTSCGDVSDSTFVTVIDQGDLEMGLLDSVVVCSNDLPYIVSIDNPLFVYFEWNNIYYSTEYSITEGGLQTVKGSSYCGFSYDSIYVNVVQGPDFDFPDLLSVCDSNATILYAPSGSTNIWNDTLVSDSLYVDTSGVYTLLSTTANGCERYDTIEVVFNELSLEALQDTVLCLGDTLDIYAISNADDFTWNVPSNGNHILVSDTGFYYVLAFKESCIKLSSFTVSYTNSSNSELALVDSLFACPTELPIEVVASGDPAVGYLWENGDVTNTTFVDHEGWLSIIATFDCASKSDSVFLHINEIPLLSLPNDTTLCQNATLQLAINGNDQYEWNTGQVGNAIVVDAAGSYSVNAMNLAGCTNADSVQVFLSNLFLELESPIWFCENDSVLITANSNGENYQWNTGADSQSILVTQPGFYTVQSYADGCSLSQEAIAITFDVESFDLGNDTVLVEGSSLVLSGPAGYSNYDWSVDGEVQQNILINQPGNYSLSVQDENGCWITDEINITFVGESTNSFITVPGQFNTHGGGLIAFYNNVSVYDVKIFDDIGRLVHYSNSFPMIWDGRTNGTPSANAVYYYIINYQDGSGRKHIKKGKVLLAE